MPLEKMDEFFNARAITYDQHMLVNLQLAKFYEEIARCFSFDIQNPKLLDLGCGTGLELEHLFAKFSDISVTGIDLSQEMLNVFNEKYSDKNIKIICGSYFTIDFGIDCYDSVISTYSLHHFTEEEKVTLYKKIFDSLVNGGIYIEGDYTCKTMEEQLLYIAENERLRNENGISEGFYHYDTPFTIETQIKLLKTAGFGEIKVINEWDNTTIFSAKKT